MTTRIQIVFAERGCMEQRGEYRVRMNDPEGNEFCVQ